MTSKFRTVVGFIFGAATVLLAACSNQSGRIVDDSAWTESSLNISFAAEGWTAKTLPELAEALASGEVTSVELTTAYLNRIEAIDRNGPTLQSVLTINPDALALAKDADAKRASGETLGPLHGVPILVKDNVETKDAMATTAGSFALANNLTGRDSPSVAGLRDAGAIILGKTNLTQWANFRSNDAISGWSAVGGQTRNPHMLDRTTCGSSSGSGAAVAASLAAGAIGTETNGSIICPSNANGIVGFKPTVGLVSQQFIVPISKSQDTAGPMTKSVEGAAMILSAMATSEARVDFVESLDENALVGARVGVLRFSVGQNTDINQMFDAALVDIQNAGGEIVEIEQSLELPQGYWEYHTVVLETEFKDGLNKYLQTTPPVVRTRSLEDLISFNATHRDKELALFDQSIFVSSQTASSLDDAAYVEARDTIQQASREDGIDALLAQFEVDVLVSPSGVLAPRVDPINGDVWPEWSGAGYLAAIAGYPHASVPMGEVHGMPIGLSFIGTANSDAAILSFAYAYEQETNHRKDPSYLQNADARREISAAIKRGNKLDEE